MRRSIEYTLPQVVRLVGADYDKVRYVVGFKRVVEPRRIGTAWLFSTRQVEELKRYFALSAHDQRHYGKDTATAKPATKTEATP